MTPTTKIQTQYLMILLLQMSFSISTNGFSPISWKLGCHQQQRIQQKQDLCSRLTYSHGNTKMTYCQVLADPTILDTTTTATATLRRRRPRSQISSPKSRIAEDQIPILPSQATTLRPKSKPKNKSVVSSASSSTRKTMSRNGDTLSQRRIDKAISSSSLYKDQLQTASTRTMSIPTTNTLMIQQQPSKSFTSSGLSKSTHSTEMKSQRDIQIGSTSNTRIGNPSILTTTTSLGRSRSSTMPGYSIKSKNQILLERAKKQQQQMNKSGWSLEKSIDTSNDDRMDFKSRNSYKSKDAMYQSSTNVPDSLVQFAKELHQESRITPNEELELGQLTQEAIQLQSLYDSLEARLEREPSDEEWCAAAGKINMEAIRQAIEAGTEAKNKLVTSNLRLVQGVVNVYIRNGLSGQYNAGDMMQEGIMALIRAAEKFEPQRGFRFSTYAMYWIRSAVKRSQTFQSRVITIPQRLHANHKRIQIIQRQLRQTLGRPPTYKEWANAAGISESQLERCLKAMEQRCYSLDQPIRYSGTSSSSLSSNQDSSLYDVVESKAGSVDGNTRRKSLPQSLLRESLVETLFRTLDKESAQLLLLRFGLVDQDILPEGWEGPLTIAQVSQLVGKKPDKVRRQILKSLNDLKCTMGNDWRDFESIIEG